ncbi:MAG: amino acid-binding protein [Desulfamplus sp.]|nr:amino acid-binding protein [Desulfamplus sp.]
MNKIVVTILGKDRPGIIASVSKSLYQMDCNLQNVNQMILQNQFAGFFIIDHPTHLTLEVIRQQLEKDLADQKLHIHADIAETKGNDNHETDEEIFLITTIGPDQKGLVSRFTEIIASYNVNVTKLTAIFKGGDEPTANIMSYQVAITPDTNQAGLFKSLRQKALELGLDISIQHKNIFETINKI